MITFHGPMRRAVPWLGTVFIAGIVALAVFDAVRGHRLAIEQTGRELDSQARIIAEQTTRSLQAVDVVLRHVQAQFREGRLAAMTTEQLHAYLREQAVGLVQIDGLAIVNADGALHALSSGHPPPALSVAGNPAFESFRGGPGAGPVFIGPARRSADGTWMFPIARRLEADGGAFAGVVGARGRVEHYQQFYRDIRLGSGTGTALMHIDGTLVARHPPAVPALGQRFALFEELLAAQRAGEAGPLRRASPVDGVDRFAALQTLPDYPVAVVVTRDADVALASWRDQAVNTAVRTLALAALAGLLLALTMRQLSSLQAARDSLESALAASLEDLTRRRTAEAERDRLESQLRQAQKLEAIGTLAGGIAHDFNNILSAMLGYGEMAQKEAPDGSRLRRHVDAAMSAGLRAKSLVERILTFSRSGIGERVPVHVQSVVVEALELVAASLPPGVRLEPQLDAGDSAVLGDATQIHQVVMNLCANAVQAMRSSGVLELTVQAVELDAPLVVSTSTLPAGPYVRLAVSDTGTGIAPQVLERIFDPFFTTKEVGVGTGLGLSLVHGIVTDLSGGIDVRSHPGAGSSFTVWLPRHGSVEAPVAALASVPEGDGQTVMLVDDEDALVRLGEEMMAALGYEPVGFVSGAAALASFRATPERYSAVLTDESMPDITGFELARAIRAIRPDIPIILMSGYVTSALAARARDIGVTEVLAKPLVSADIARGLAHALRR